MSNLVNKANLVHNFFLVCIFLFSACFGRLCAHRQEKQLYLCDSCYTRCIPDSHLRKTTSIKFICVLYMFRATMCPSSGETTVFMRHLIYKVHNRQSSTQNKYQVYFFSVHVSGDCVHIVRRNNCIYATLGIQGA